MSIAEKRYITFREMMTRLVDTSNRKCLILDQINKMLNNEIAKLLRKSLNSANTLKINDYLNHIGVLKKKIEEGQSNVVEMEPSQILNLNASAQELPEDLQYKKKPSLVQNAAEIQVHSKTPKWNQFQMQLIWKFKWRHQQRKQFQMWPKWKFR
ncbi:hypothetical protein ACFX2F_028002 [Malus domestica]